MLAWKSQPARVRAPDSVSATAQEDRERVITSGSARRSRRSARAAWLEPLPQAVRGERTAGDRDGAVDRASRDQTFGHADTRNATEHFEVCALHRLLDPLHRVGRDLAVLVDAGPYGRRCSFLMLASVISATSIVTGGDA